MNLAGKVILVTGASQGLGLGIADLISRLGARVILVARDKDRLLAAYASINRNDNIVEPFDLLDYDQIGPWMKALSDRHGALSGVVHSAGILPTKPLRLLVASDWDKAMRVNVAAGAALAKGFRQRGDNINGGSIVFLSSVMGFVGQPGQVLYSATKGALIAMARSMALELSRESIRVNCVAPAVVAAGMSEDLQRSLSEEQFKTIVDQHPLGIGAPKDVANAVAFLLADTARWITGTTLVVDGGYLAH